MSISVFFMAWKDIGLCLYAILKAFLPLPSLEVILIPLCVSNPEKWLIYSLEGAVGTLVGGAIGYLIAKSIGYRALSHMASKKDIDKGEALMNRYGMLAVFIGGVTPIPDFLLAYLAGFTNMSFWRFIITDGVARLLRSLLVCGVLKELGMVMDVDRYGTIFSLAIIVVLFARWFIEKYKSCSD